MNTKKIIEQLKEAGTCQDWDEKQIKLKAILVEHNIEQHRSGRSRMCYEQIDIYTSSKEELSKELVDVMYEVGLLGGGGQEHSRQRYFDMENDTYILHTYTAIDSSD